VARHKYSFKKKNSYSKATVKIKETKCVNLFICSEIIFAQNCGSGHSITGQESYTKMGLISSMVSAVVGCGVIWGEKECSIVLHILRIFSQNGQNRIQCSA